MKSEAAKGILRITTNYARLGGNLILSFLLVPFMLAWVGNGAWSLVLLLGAGTGLAAMFREITDRAVVRELASALHDEDPGLFPRVYNSALVISAGSACAVLLCFVGLFIAVRVHALDIKPGLEPAAYALLLTQGSLAVLTTLISPIFNMQVVAERFVLYNTWTLLDRTSFMLSALLVRYGLHVSGTTVGDQARAITLWTLIATAMELACIGVPIAVMMIQDPRMRPAVSKVQRTAVHAIFSTFRWYVAVEVSNNLYDRAGFIFSNIANGRNGNLVYGVGQQLVNYVSQVAYGISQGLDAISARLESKSGRSIPMLVYHTTRLMALAAIPVGVMFFVLAPELVRLWVGRTIERPDQNVPMVATTVQLMAPAITIRAVASGWTAILYGAGHLRRYAPILLTGGIINVVLTTIAVFVAMKAGAPELLKQYLIPGILCVVNSVVYLYHLPRVGSRCLGLRFREMYLPLLRPVLATAICTPILLVASPALGRLGLSWNLYTLAGVAATFGGCYVLAAAVLVLEPSERTRFMWTPVRRALGRA